MPVRTIGDISHAWALNVGNARTVKDSAGNADGVFGSGTGGTTGNYWVIGKNAWEILFDNSGTGTTASTKLQVGDATGSAAPKRTSWTFECNILYVAYAKSQTIFGGSTNGIQIRINSSNAIELLKQGVASIGASTSTLTTGNRYRIAVSYNGTTARFHINGAPCGSSSSSQSFTHAQYCLGWAPGIPAEYLDNGNKLSGICFTNRVITDAEVFNRYLNPWQIFRPLKRTTYFLPPLYDTLDETTASDSDYIETSGTGNSSIILLGSGSDPGNDNNHQLRYRASSTSETLNVDVVQMAPAIVTSNRKWNRQPQGAVGIDWSNPVTRGIKFLWNAVSNKSRSSYLTYVSKAGIALSDTSSDSNAGQVSSLTNELTIFSFCDCGALNNSDGNRAVVGANFTFLGQSAYDSGTSVYAYVYYYPDYSGASAVNVPSALQANKTYAVVTTYKRNTYHRIYLNGVISGEVTPGDYGVNFSGTVAVGSVRTASLHPLLCVAFNRALSAAEVYSLSANPWQIFKPRKQIQYFDAPKLIATRTPSLTSSPSDQTIDLTSGEAAAITDYTKLGLRFRT